MRQKARIQLQKQANLVTVKGRPGVSRSCAFLLPANGHFLTPARFHWPFQRRSSSSACASLKENKITLCRKGVSLCVEHKRTGQTVLMLSPNHDNSRCCRFKECVNCRVFCLKTYRSNPKIMSVVCHRTTNLQSWDNFLLRFFANALHHQTIDGFYSQRPVQH